MVHGFFGMIKLNEGRRSRATLTGMKQDHTEKDMCQMRRRIVRYCPKRLSSGNYLFVLQIQNSLARYEACFGDKLIAAELFREVAEGRRRVLGKTHIATFEALYEYSLLLYFDENKKERCAEIISILQSYKEVLNSLCYQRAKSIMAIPYNSL